MISRSKIEYVTPTLSKADMVEKPTRYKQIKVGDIVAERVHMHGFHNGLLKTGVVVYVHPKGRFYRVKFPGKRAPVTEAYLTPIASIDEGKP